MNMMKGVNRKLHDAIVKPAQQCDNETWVLREEEKKKTEQKQLK
jgi:hypothetical protein